MAIFTIVLALVTRRQARLTRQIIELQREEFLATHRPKIIVHGVEHATISGAESDLVGVVVTYVNAGTGRAKIVDIASKIVPISGEPRPGIQMDVTPVKDKSLDSGERAIHAVDSNISEDAADNPAVQIWCAGHIRYEDTGGKQRQTGFCRRYDATNRMWLRVPNSDYEYDY